MNVAFRIFCFVLLLFVGIVPLSASATHSGPAHWENGVVEVRDYTAPKFGYGLQQTITDWDNISPNLTITLVDMGEQPCPGFISGVVVVCNGNYGFNQHSARALYYNDGNYHMTMALIRFDNEDFQGVAYNDRGMLHIQCHEFGHVLALGHHDFIGSCVTDSNQRINPGPHDVTSIAARYDGHQHVAASSLSAEEGPMLVSYDD